MPATCWELHWLGLKVSNPAGFRIISGSSWHMAKWILAMLRSYLDMQLAGGTFQVTTRPQQSTTRSRFHAAERDSRVPIGWVLSGFEVILCSNVISIMHRSGKCASIVEGCLCMSKLHQTYLTITKAVATTEAHGVTASFEHGYTPSKSCSQGAFWSFLVTLPCLF